MLQRGVAPAPVPLSMLKLEKTGGTSLASTIVSSCVAHHCSAGRNCPLGHSSAARACGVEVSNSQHNGLDSWQTCRVVDSERSPLAAALRACMRLPLLVNKATTDVFGRRRSVCAIAPRSSEWADVASHWSSAATARDRMRANVVLVVLREPMARLLSALYYFNGHRGLAALSGRQVRTINASHLTLNAMRELLKEPSLLGPNPVEQLGGSGMDTQAAIARSTTLLSRHCLVGLTERPDETRALLTLRTALSADALVSCGRKRVGDSAHRGVLPLDAHAVLATHFAAERALYDHATSVHQMQVDDSAPPHAFARTVQRVKVAQAAFEADCANADHAARRCCGQYFVRGPMVRGTLRASTTPCPWPRGRQGAARRLSLAVSTVTRKAGMEFRCSCARIHLSSMCVVLGLDLACSGCNRRTAPPPGPHALEHHADEH